MTQGKNAAMQDAKGQVILYKNHLEVSLEQDTVWRDAHLIAKIFDVDRTVIVKHISRIYKTGELSADGKTSQMNIYNLDVILSVRYRVNSERHYFIIPSQSKIIIKSEPAFRECSRGGDLQLRAGKSYGARSVTARTAY
jgi:hypothetical protein